MNIKNLQTYFLFALLSVVLVFSFLIFRPFLYAIILAAAIAIVFRPFYRKALKFFKGRDWLAAAASTLIVVAFIIAPLFFLISQIFQETQGLYFYLSESENKKGIISAIKNLIAWLNNFFPFLNNFSFDIEQYARQGLDWLFQHFGAIFSNMAKISLSFFIFLVALYYMLKDGHKLKKSIITLSPLSDLHDETIFLKLKTAVSSAVMGNLIIATIKGLLTAAGFVFFGISNPILWGTVAAVAALVPGIGTALVIIPAVFFLFVGGKIISAAGLLAWGVIVVGLIDNFLGPRLIGRGMRLHPLIILLSVLGGIAFFGPIGFLLGPIVISLLFALFDVYASLIKENK